MKSFLQALQGIFVLCLIFGSYFLWRYSGDQGGFYTRVFSWSLLAVGATGCALWTIFGLWQKPTSPGGIPRDCPECGAALPVIRLPKNRREMLWGGVTCPGCGMQFDRHGRKLGKRDGPDPPGAS